MIKKFKEYNKQKFKKGDRCVFVNKLNGDKYPSVFDDNMTIEDEPTWYEYDNHPNKGYWTYPIIGKSNDCPEDLLRLYDGQKIGETVEPIYYKK